MLTTEELIARLNEQHTAVVAHHEKNRQTLDGVNARLVGVEQAIAAQRGIGGGRGASQSWGNQVLAAEAYRISSLPARTARRR